MDHQEIGISHDVVILACWSQLVTSKTGIILQIGVALQLHDGLIELVCVHRQLKVVFVVKCMEDLLTVYTVNWKGSWSCNDFSSTGTDLVPQ